MRIKDFLLSDEEFIISSEGKWSYNEIGEMVNQREGELREMGINRHERVALVVQNSLKDIVNIFSLISLQSEIILLNNMLTEEEKKEQITISQATGLLSQKGIYEKTNHTKGEGKGSKLILFTSGTSGKPKAVVLNPNNFWYNALASKERMGLNKGDSWLLTLPLYHVGGLAILFRALYLSLKIVVMEKFDVERVIEGIMLERFNVVSLVPTMLYRILQKEVEALKKLKVILLGGAKPMDDMLKICVENKLKIFTTYGMTESCSQISTATPNMVYRDRTSVGKPLEGMVVEIKNGEKSSKQGEIGSIIISGKQLFEGYVGEERDEERFDTGDLGYLDERGELHIVGRANLTIITGGENVYPLEIEEKISTFQGVEKVCVVGIEDEEWGERIEVAIEGEGINLEKLEDFLRESLARFKIPKKIHVMKLPLTNSGKINRSKIKKIVTEFGKKNL